MKLSLRTGTAKSKVMDSVQLSLSFQRGAKSYCRSMPNGLTNWYGWKQKRLPNHNGLH